MDPRSDVDHHTQQSCSHGRRIAYQTKAVGQIHLPNSNQLLPSGGYAPGQPKGQERDNNSKRGTTEQPAYISIRRLDGRGNFDQQDNKGKGADMADKAGFMVGFHSPPEHTRHDQTEQEGAQPGYVDIRDQDSRESDHSQSPKAHFQAIPAPSHLDQPAAILPQ